jgi:hypothetical protein
VVGGRKFEESLAQRTVGVLVYLRLNTSQTVIARMFGLQQYEIVLREYGKRVLGVDQ